MLHLDPNKDDFKKLSRVIRFHRKRARLSMNELARLADVGKTAVFDVEHEKQSVRFDTIIKILGVLNIGLGLTGPLINDFMKAEGENEKG